MSSHQQGPRFRADALIRNNRRLLRKLNRQESFWSSMQVELLNRKKWRTRVSLANAMFDFIESSYNHNRRHSRLGRSTPIEHELRLKHQAVPQRIGEFRRSLQHWVLLGRIVVVAWLGRGCCR
ncbi:IS3 family transposase [Glaciihabitans sp. GrIS 2.15]|uniref:IS3 family transposase n=1 Tax=Glaciihabitans sp. GrIS 2.15 TaxID=3071710 RepID=UPI003FA3C77E